MSEFKMDTAATGIINAYNAQDTVRIVMGKEFTKGNGFSGWAMTAVDINEKSSTAGFRFSGFANQTVDNSVFMPQFNHLDLPMAIFNRIKDAILAMGDANKVQDDKLGFIFTKRAAYSGNGSWVSCRVIDESSPFFAMNFRCYTNESARGAYVSPDGFKKVDNYSDSVSFDLPTRSERVQTLIADRDADGKIQRDANGQVTYTLGKAHWAPVAYQDIDLIGLVMEHRLCSILVDKVVAQRAAVVAAAAV